MYHIGLIGAGQLGSRHLQSLATSELECTIHVVEPNPQSMDTARERVAQVERSPRVASIEFYADAASLPNQLDLTVVSCSSDVRLAVLRQIATGAGARNYILDKVVFQSKREFEEAAQLLTRAGANCWINCQRRMLPFYDKLKKEFAGLGPVTYRVSSGDWGIGCNSIHFIDHLAWLIGSSTYVLDTSGLDSTIHQSKRPGYVEFTGALQGRFVDGSTFVLEAVAGKAPEFQIAIETPELAANIDEAKGEMVLIRKGASRERREFSFPYQSQLTRLLAESILERDECPLTSFAESMKLHLPLLEGLTAHLEKSLSRRFDRCPIT